MQEQSQSTLRSASTVAGLHVAAKHVTYLASHRCAFQARDGAPNQVSAQPYEEKRLQMYDA